MKTERRAVDMAPSVVDSESIQVRVQVGRDVVFVFDVLEKQILKNFISMG